MRITLVNLKRVSKLAPVLVLLSIAPTPASAVLPLAAGIGQEILQNLIFDGVKGQLIESMAGMGCKGSMLAGMLAEFDVAGTGGAPSGITFPSDMAGGLVSESNALSADFGASDSESATQSSPSVAEAERVTGHKVRQVSGNLAVGQTPPDMASALALAQREVSAGLGGNPFGMAPDADNTSQVDPQQMQQAMAIMGQIQDSMAKPLSRSETRAVFDELAQLGVLTPDLHNQINECILLAPPSADKSLGQAGAMFKSTVLPQLRSTKVQLTTLPPEQQLQLVDEMSQALEEADPHDRKAFFDGLGQGFFPQFVVDGVKAKIGAP